MAIVNSRFADRWYFLKFETTHMAGGYIRYDTPYLEQLPIPDMTEDNQFNLISIVDRILDSGHLDRASEHLILQVDAIVYKLFKLGYDEIKTLDPDFTFSESEYDAIVI